MCDIWEKPKQGVSLTRKCKCGTRVIRKDREGVYVPLIRKGSALQNVGYKSFDEARGAYE